MLSNGGCENCDEDESFVVLGSSPPETSLAQRSSSSFETNNHSNGYGPLDNQGLLSITNVSHGPLTCDCVKKLTKEQIGKVIHEFNEIIHRDGIEISPDLEVILCSHRQQEKNGNRKDDISGIREENNALRDTLKRNNIAIREQFKAIETWRDDVMETHRLHKEKFLKTKELVNKLKNENATLKQELENLNKNPLKTIEYIEKESDLIQAELEDLKKENEKLIEENSKLKEEKAIEAKYENLAEAEKTNLQRELTATNVKLLQSENTKLEFTKYKEETWQKMRDYENEIRDLRSQLKDNLQLILAPPTTIGDDEKKTQYTNIIKELSRIINFYVNEFQSLDKAITSLHKKMLSSTNPTDFEQSKGEITTVKKKFDSLHIRITEHNMQIKDILALVESMLLDYQKAKMDMIATNEKLESETAERKAFSNQLSETKVQSISQNETIQKNEAEFKALREIIQNLQKECETMDILRAQMDSYKADFEAERNARTNLASEKQQLIEQLRNSMRSSRVNQSINAIEEIEFPEREISPPLAVYVCPICENNFRDERALQTHVEICLENNR